MQWLNTHTPFLSHLFSLLLIALSQPAFSGNTESTGRLSFVLENDFFVGNDRNYTNGLKFIWIPNEATKTPEWATKAANAIPWFPKDGTIKHGYAFGQSIFTPDDITLKNPPKESHPYAGWLYATMGIASEKNNQLDLMTFTLGVVGPAAMAEDSQKFIHTLINSDDPKGWDTQLKNELGFILTHKHIWRGVKSFSVNQYELDISPYTGASIGNIHTNASLGATLRFGKNLPQDFGPPRVQPSMPSGTDFNPSSQQTNWYAFLGFEGQAVARNIFLDGNTFRNSRNVDKKPLVADIQFGVVFDWKDLRLGYTHVFRTKQFTTQNSTDGFGSVTLNFAF
ncbi:lipid A deacylase LpxR family protein [Thiomicrorhabdus indica]|uniref:lipid A deacylase LpxR family protein n=1 Tax=Thiomicrorhabdus indica TaxID=2267253 RepID=UPI00102DE997|nr:lipid A deacylase LpxR family protein [Thiomicrorhabdus indica]